MASFDGSPFLHGAVAYLYGPEAPEACAGCGFAWSTGSDAALELIAASPSRYAQLLRGRDGMAPAADGGWNATSFVWHLADLARGWSERWVFLANAPGSTFAGWDPDELAEARNYRNLPTVSALWAIETSVATFVQVTKALDPSTPFLHGQWGEGTVGDATRWIAHEFFHHRGDVAARSV